MNAISIITTSIACTIILYEGIKYIRIGIISKKYADEYVDDIHEKHKFDEPFKLIKVGE